MSSFKLVSDFRPSGDQPAAIDAVCHNLLSNKKHQVLLGVTGSGKTFTLANIIARIGKPTLIIAPNKTLAAQLYSEFKGLFPENAVEYFVSYYDYYQPEAYIPASDTYIQKDASINEMIDKLRHSATRSVLSRRDVIIVASVSCIFGIGAPADYLAMRVAIRKGAEYARDTLLHDLTHMQYDRNDVDFHRGVFRVRGDRVEIFPAYEENVAVRIDFFGDLIDDVAEIDPMRGTVNRRLQSVSIFPASHYVTEKETRKRAVDDILLELKTRIEELRNESKLLEMQRIEERTHFDVEMIQEIGYCTGIENYSRHLTGSGPGEPPPVLLDYFPDDYLMCIDESHITIPQVRAMYKGDRSRKETLVEFGFRLPSALDNRPLRFDEFESKLTQVIYVSATPADYEQENGDGAVTELIVRPTGLIDPQVRVKEARNQVDDLYEEIGIRKARNERILITTLTKRMAEDLTEYYTDLGIEARYLHADINTLDRMDIIRDLRMGEFDVLIGINLLREGLDIPEVSLVAILDADKEGFLRSTRSLVQTIGRASRNVRGQVIMYADTVTRSMRQAIDETNRRRRIQQDHNRSHNITPKTIHKEITSVFEHLYEQESPVGQVAEDLPEFSTLDDVDTLLSRLEKEMNQAAEELAFERAAELRDRIQAIQKKAVISL